MEIRQLEAFKAVIEHQLVTRAAEAMGVTQPAVSAQLARLEAELGFALFMHVGRRLQPTPEALLLYEEVSSALHGMERLLQTAVEIRRERLGQVTIASHPWAALSLLPEAAARFLRAKPEVKLRFVTRTSDALRDLMQAQAFDVGIVEAPADAMFTRVSSHRFRCVALLPEGHRLAKHEQVTPKQLEGEPFICSFRGHPMYHETSRAFAQAGAAWNVQVEAQFGATIAAIVAQGAGVGISDPLSASSFARRGLVVRRFEPAIEYEIAIVHHAQRQPSLVAKAFIDALVEHIGGMPEFTASPEKGNSRRAASS